MNPYEDSDLDGRFRDAWKEWAGQAPRLSPEQAAARVAARLEPRGRGHALWAYAAAAALLSVVAGLSYLWLAVWTPVSAPGSVLQQAAPIEEGVVLMWLDDKTPLYMNFQPPRGSRVR